MRQKSSLAYNAAQQLNRSRIRSFRLRFWPSGCMIAVDGSHSTATSIRRYLFRIIQAVPEKENAAACPRMVSCMISVCDSHAKSVGVAASYRADANPLHPISLCDF